MHTCGIEGCGKKFERGGRASPEAPKLARCPMHYHRERRGSKLAAVPGERVAGVRREVYLPPDVDKALMKLAMQTRTATVAKLLELAVLDFLDLAEARSVADVRRKGKR